MSGVNLFGNEMLSRKKPTIAANLSRFLVVPPRPFQLRARHRPADSPRERQRACVRARARERATALTSTGHALELKACSLVFN